MDKPGRRYPLGYFLVFLPPVLLLVGQASGTPYLLFLTLFALGPFLRAVLGDIPEQGGDWSERMTTLLDRLPAMAAVVYPLAIAASLFMAAAHPPANAIGWVGTGLSMWTCMLCAIPIAHELVHRRGGQRRMGGLLAGMTGYPVLEGEHIPHHSMSGTVDPPEWPRLDESVWRYAVRRTPRVIGGAIQYHAMFRGTNRWRRFGLVEATTATALTCGAFTAALGGKGALLYLCVAAGIHFAVQAINYIQHWGLGSDSLADAGEGRYAWECRCRLQGWLFLNIALHHSHHQGSATPYYRLAPYRGSPRLPGSYIPLLFASMVPPLWQWLMRPALESWKLDPALQREPRGLRIVCVPARYLSKGADPSEP